MPRTYRRLVKYTSGPPSISLGSIHRLVVQGSGDPMIGPDRAEGIEKATVMNTRTLA